MGGRNIGDEVPEKVSLADNYLRIGIEDFQQAVCFLAKVISRSILEGTNDNEVAPVRERVARERANLIVKEVAEEYFDD